MSGKCRPSLRKKTLYKVEHSNLSQTDKDCIKAVFELAEKQRQEIEHLKQMLIDSQKCYYIEADNELYDTVANWCKAISNNLVKETVGDNE